MSGIKIYDYDKADLQGSRQRLASVVKGHLQQIEQVKSLKVEVAIRSLSGECLKLLNAAGAAPYFSDPQATFQAQEAVLVPVKMASAKLLELGITYCDYNHAANRYAYHWTEFGRAVMRKLGIIKGAT